MKGQTYIILALIFAVIVAIFAVINVDPVEVNFLFGTGDAPLILVILVSVLMGGIITGSVGIVRLIRLQREIRGLKQENTQLKETNQHDGVENREEQGEPLSASKIGQSSNE
ncbi:LapA family protein [Aquibacillus rhizosphaerae]|uniref:Lipopolysaccharide assembly protein LapA domain-containing protein n=1 Tax=Aquibacillus rhizosphaerae TaxID=3051431 RepID=A0ABT7L6E2_9BACI|nr:lipopolysaccharide assembly protein LapA domain-containing protein [Aquibacillus sp. LR5S19]MDL4841433.1 lipopolysaccharide assembly protein LapA domain-containing protein [Aquibacillus sp. LR5S19]